MVDDTNRWEQTCPLDKGQVTKAVEALKAYIDVATKKGSTKTLLDDHQRIQIQVDIHRIAALKGESVYIKLPHPLYLQNTEVCLITTDEDKGDAEKTEEHYRKILTEQKITSISRILPLRQLKLDYNTYESRRALADMFDIFLCDKRLMHCMPRLLGKHFLSKRKDPSPVNMNGKVPLKEEISKALSQTRWYMSGNGASSVLTAAKTTSPVAHIVDNVMACAVEIARHAPRGWANVKSLHVKTDSSIALPVYANDHAVDVDGLEKREVSYIDRKRQRRDCIQEMWDLTGVTEKKKGRFKLGSKKAKAEKI